MVDRSSRPRSCPHRTPTRRERRVIGLRVSRRWGPARIAYLLGMHPSTVHRILTRYGCLAGLDRPGHRRPATSPASPGRALRTRRTRRPGPRRHQEARPDPRRRRPQGAGPSRRQTQPRRGIGLRYIHNAVDDHSRLAYSELLADERKETAAAFWSRAKAYFAGAGITVQPRADRQRLLLPLPRLRPGPGRPRSRTSGPGPTGPRPTARSNASTGPCSRNGPTPAPTSARPNAQPPSPTGSTPTITTAATPHSRRLTRRPCTQPGGAVHLAAPRGRRMTHPYTQQTRFEAPAGPSWTVL